MPRFGVEAGRHAFLFWRLAKIEIRPPRQPSMALRVLRSLLSDKALGNDDGAKWPETSQSAGIWLRHVPRNLWLWH